MADNDRQNKSQQRSNPSQQEKTAQPGGLQSRRDANRNQMARPYSSWSSGSPFDLMRRLNDEMDRWFGGGFGNLPSLSNFGGFEAVWAPNVEVFQRGDELVVRADLPGLGKSDVDVEVSDDALTIRGERKQEHEEEREGYYRSERSYGSFYRTIPLPEGAIADSAKANFRNGVLEVTVQVPPAEVRRGRKLEIGEGHANQQQKGERAESAQSKSNTPRQHQQPQQT